MTLIRNFTLGLLLLSCAAYSSFAQDRADARPPSPPTTTVTISTSAKGIRVAALGDVRQIRLEVLGAGGDSLYSSGFQPGGVRDWDFVDAHGQRLPDGSYQCLVTFRDLSGRLGTKQGAVLLQGGQPSLQLSEAEQSGPVEPEKRLSPVAGDEVPAVTLTAHDGTDGQVVSTRGALSFRAGDFFAGKDRELMRLTPEGNLGLGVASPKAKLDVAGTIRVSGGILFADGTALTSARDAKPPQGAAPLASSAGTVTPSVAGTGTQNQLTKWQDGAGALADSALFESGGFLGVGTRSPLGVIHAQNSPGTYTTGFFDNYSSVPAIDGEFNFRKSHADTTGANGQTLSGEVLGTFGFWGNTGTAFQQGAFLQGVQQGAAGAFIPTKLIFRTSDGAAGAAERMVLDRSGNLGIGTTTPQAKLDVAGDIKVSGSAVVDGNIAAKYQDVAEWVPASREMTTGTVVVLDATRNNAVAPSSRPYDVRVAGVVSARPGVVLGEGGVGKVMVATTGRVKVRVDAGRRPVRVGDLLVTSGKPGVAMRSVPVRAGRARIHRPGTILGKALEPLAKGEGEILVLLSLQ